MSEPNHSMTDDTTEQNAETDIDAHALNVLVIGSGGREHAIALALRRSPRLKSLYVAPGNGGTVDNNVDLDVGDHGAVVAFCQAKAVDLVIVGPEGPLVAGLADDLRLAEIAVFGPSGQAARLEGSKTFAREFAKRYDIPGPAFKAFDAVEPALAWIDKLDAPVVVKADGLASGKGVIVPDTQVEAERAVFDFLSERTMGDAGSTIVVEERLVGEEISLFGICDGEHVVVLGTAQDHKRVGEGDTGLNTGGMGAFSPVPGKRELEEELAQQFLAPVCEGMIKDGSPYVGVIYAGLMLTDDGPRLVEYNCRFGDPEAQVLLPLLDCDLLAVLDAAANGRLEKLAPDLDLPRLVDRTAATVVVAAAGYPASPATGIEIPDQLSSGSADDAYDGQDVQIIHGSTEVDDGGQVVNTGGRVLAVTGVGDDLSDALTGVYQVVGEIVNDYLFARRDIGWRYMPGDAYARSGVSLTSAAEVGNRIGRAVVSTHDSRVVAGHGSFGGVFDLAQATTGIKNPLLVASTDGVGTKSLLAAETDSWESVGADIVNHGVNDVLVQGARPMFFLDTVAAASLEPEIVGRVVDGMAEACLAANCVLLGGETAEMPDVLASGAVDISGTMVGVVDRSRLLPRADIKPGYALVGVASSGLHTNGYTLARKVFSGTDLSEPLLGGDGESIGAALMATHRNYQPVLAEALARELVAGLAHITGGGLIDNLPRILPDGCGAVIDTGAWSWPPLFRTLVNSAGMNRIEAHRVFNLGIGMVVVVPPEDVEELQSVIDEPTWLIGRVVDGHDVALS